MVTSGVKCGRKSAISFMVHNMYDVCIVQYCVDKLHCDDGDVRCELLQLCEDKYSGAELEWFMLSYMEEIYTTHAL